MYWAIKMSKRGSGNPTFSESSEDEIIDIRKRRDVAIHSESSEYVSKRGRDDDNGKISGLPDIPYNSFRSNIFSSDEEGTVGNPHFDDDFEQDGVMSPEETSLYQDEEDEIQPDLFDDLVLNSVAMSHDSVYGYLKQQAEFKNDQLAPDKRHIRIKKGVGKHVALKGSVRVDRIRRLLSSFTDDQGKLIRRSEPQQTVHEVYIRACLPKIYDDEWDDNREHIMKKFGITRLQMWVLVVMARREGKTWGMAMFIAAMVLSVSDTEISIFATCKRTAEKLLKVFHKFLLKAMAILPGEEFIIIKKTQETIILMGPDGTERIIGCYPASVR